jgi:hydroxymethylpyrimidine pyrophosphatase-like HAD family hydrolase
MRYQALAVDYDGTIATDGHVDDATRAALRRLRASGRRLLLVTGRTLADLAGAFGDLALFELVVAENGAVLHDPALRTSAVLCEPPPPSFAAELARRGVADLAVGQAVVAMHASLAPIVLALIQDSGLSLQVVFNREALMVLPAGIHKGTGLGVALARMGVHAGRAVAIGDAENDHAMLSLCGYGAAVANAVPALKARAQLVTRGERGQGVAEVIERLIAFDLPERAPQESVPEVPLPSERLPQWRPASPSATDRTRPHNS